MHIQYGGSTQGLPRVSVGIGGVSFISGVSTWPPVGSPSQAFFYVQDEGTFIDVPF